ncbi:4'-phosphopantetheinyl transferase superfamily protein [Kribbella sp. NPDC050124]|uniref:4'-phosphopantetheinyl transferase superfamily protein n=1 Tax=Kribbella sp. NPDC050124 TaxID=3364114 RepID=UPI003798D898
MNRSIGARHPVVHDDDEVVAMADVRTLPVLPGAVSSAGVDLVDQHRFALAVRRTGPKFLHHVFDDTEFAGAPASSGVPDGPRLAELGRLFGIKESVVKVVGGLPKDGRYRDIVVSGLDSHDIRTIELRGCMADWAVSRQVELVGGVLAGEVPLPALDLCWAAAIRVPSPAAAMPGSRS